MGLKKTISTPLRKIGVGKAAGRGTRVGHQKSNNCTTFQFRF
jgi:hypothetical protein